MNVFSFGGGVQSTAALVLAAQGDLACDAFLFANVGEDSENPDTLRYVRDVSMPYAKAHGITLIELQRHRKTGETESLYERLTRPGGKAIGIPVRLAGSGAPGNRTCTQDFKIKVIAKWCREHGATAKKPATTMLGISLDEFQRMRNDSGISYTRLAYPLIDRRMHRQDCINVIVRAGLPVPPKSSCWFCPFHSLRAWRDIRDRQPELFQRACELEASLSVRLRTLKSRHSLGERDAVYMTNKLVPLAKAVGMGVQPSLFADIEDACESGYCMV